MAAGKKGLAEMGIVRRIHFIYDRATRKFKADLQLWLDWIEYCKRSNSAKQMSKVGGGLGSRVCSSRWGTPSKLHPHSSPVNP